MTAMPRICHAGTAAVPLNAQTGQEVRADLLDPSNNHVGAVEFHLDTHGHDFQEPPGARGLPLFWPATM